MATTAEELYSNDLDDFLNKNSLSQDVSITQSNSEAIIGDGAINASKISNLKVDTITVTPTGYIRSGKTSFTDSTNSGYFLSTDGVYIGKASDVSKFKFTTSTGVLEIVGTTIDGTSTIGGRTASTIASAINTSGEATAITNGIVTTVKLALNAVTADIIAAGAITENKLYTGAVTADKIAANTITAAKIAANTITASQIASGTITADRMNVSSLSAISANIGTITAGTITGATIQSSQFANTGIKITNAGLEVYGTSSFNFITTNDLPAGYIGASSGQVLDIYNQYANIRIKTGSGGLDFGGNITTNLSIVPSSSGAYNCGGSSYLWANVYTNNLSLSGGNYINYTGGFIQSNSQFRVTGSINLTGNLTFENNASITIGGRSYFQTTGAYDSTKYYLRANA